MAIFDATAQLMKQREQQLLIAEKATESLEASLLSQTFVNSPATHNATGTFDPFYGAPAEAVSPLDFFPNDDGFGDLSWLDTASQQYYGFL